MKNYYEILEVNPKASTEVIEKTYRILVKRYHPDLQSQTHQKEAEKQIKDLNEAYGVLSDTFLREQYDMELQKEKQREMENMYQNIRQKNNNYQTNREDRPNPKKRNPPPAEQEIREDNGTFGTLFGYFKSLFKITKKTKKFSKEGLFAVSLTIIIMLVIVLIIWFVPFTNQLIRQILL